MAKTKKVESQKDAELSRAFADAHTDGLMKIDELRKLIVALPSPEKWGQVAEVQQANSVLDQVIWMLKRV